MKPRRITRSERAQPGLVLTRDVGALRKGHVIRESDLGALAGAEIDAVELDPGDLHEEAAGRRLAEAAAGEGVEVRPAEAGSFPLAARTRGVLEVDGTALSEVNQIPDLALYTHPQHSVALEGEIVGRAKVVPFVTSEERVQKAESIVRGAVRVRPFLPLRAALLVHEKIADAALEKARDSFAEKLAFFGARLLSARAISSDAVASALGEEREKGMQLLVLAGSRSMDPLDPVISALERAGARMERHGVPAYPGTLLWIAYLGDIPLVGAPSCGIFSRASSLDVVLPRLMTGERLTAARLAAIAVGGLISPSSSYRLAPYRKDAARGQLE